MAKTRSISNLNSFFLSVYWPKGKRRTVALRGDSRGFAGLSRAASVRAPLVVLVEAQGRGVGARPHGPQRALKVRTAHALRLQALLERCQRGLAAKHSQKHAQKALSKAFTKASTKAFTEAWAKPFTRAFTKTFTKQFTKAFKKATKKQREKKERKNNSQNNSQKNSQK